jgi:TetR/AcrR family transcriptional repressor of nem operon
MARPKAFDEEVALAAAMDLFWARGYEATSIADLEAHLGLGRQSLYNAFGDKHALYLKALERYAEQGACGPEAHLTGPDAGLAGIRAYFDEAIRIMAERKSPRACMLVGAVVERADQDVAVRRRCDRSRRGTQAALRRSLEVARQRGEVRADLNLEAASLLLLSQAYGLAVLGRAGARPDELRRAVETALRSLA